MQFSDIITPQDQELVDHARLDVHHQAVRWCHEMWFFLFLVREWRIRARA